MRADIFNSLQVSSDQLIDVELAVQGRPRGDEDDGQDDRNGEGDDHGNDLKGAAVVGDDRLVGQDGDGT